MAILLRLVLFVCSLSLYGFLILRAKERDPSGRSTSIVAGFGRLALASLALALVFQATYLLSTRGLIWLTGKEVVSGSGHDGTERIIQATDPFGANVVLGNISIYLGVPVAVMILLAVYILIGAMAVAWHRIWADRSAEGRIKVGNVLALLALAVVSSPVIYLDMQILVIRMAMAFNPSTFRNPALVAPMHEILFPNKDTLLAGFLRTMVIAVPIIIFAVEVNIARSLDALLKIPGRAFVPGAPAAEGPAALAAPVPGPPAPNAPVGGVAMPPAPDQAARNGAVAHPGVVRPIPNPRRPD